MNDVRFSINSLSNVRENELLDLVGLPSNFFVNLTYSPRGVVSRDIYGVAVSGSQVVKNVQAKGPFMWRTYHAVNYDIIRLNLIRDVFMPRNR